MAFWDGALPPLELPLPEEIRAGFIAAHARGEHAYFAYCHAHVGDVVRAQATE